MYYLINHKCYYCFASKKERKEESFSLLSQSNSHFHSLVLSSDCLPDGRHDIRCVVQCSIVDRVGVESEIECCTRPDEG
jgi:hypothetical protein